MNLAKIYIGPVTQNVIDAVIEFVEETNISIGFIPSRRQIEWSGGYTGYNTFDFIKYVKSKTNKVLLCRDHGGLFQGQFSKIKGVTPTKSEDLKSLICDAISGVDIIHIDPWKKYSKPEQYELGLNETVNNIILINQINDKIKFEIGTEEAIKPYVDNDLFRLLNDIEYELGDIFRKNVKYVVIQSGTRLEGTKNIGKFDLEKLKDMVKVCKHFNIFSKEHNGDYLSDEEIKIRFDNGLDAINIAPEFGVIETKVLLDNIKNKKDFEKIYDICLTGGNWKKWIPSEYHVKRHLEDSHKKHLIEICGHYHNKEIKEIIKIDNEIIKKELKNKLKNLYKISNN